MILLTDPQRCPQCAQRAVSFDAFKCTSCEVPIFDSEDDFGRFQSETNIRHFWVWFEPKRKGLFRGFVHADHLAAPRPTLDQIELKKPKPNLKPAKA